jgi:hypothetical protein
MKMTSKEFTHLLVVILLIALASVSCKRQEQATSTNTQQNPPARSNAAPSATPRKLFKSGEVVPSGYFGYKVHGSWFDSKPIKQSSPYLHVDLSVVNTDKKARPLPPLTLVDETGAEHQPSKEAWKSQGSLGLVDKLAPATSKRGFVVFEVPKDHSYRLKLRGFTSADDAFIELAPEAKPQSSSRR